MEFDRKQVEGAYWVVLAVGAISFFLWRIPAYAGPAGLVCITSILACLAIGRILGR